MDTAPAPTVTTEQWVVAGSYQDPRDPVNGVSFDFSLDGRYVMNLGSWCTGGPTACVQSGTFALDVANGKLRLSPDSGGTEVVDFTLPAASGALSTNAASLAYAPGSLQIDDDPLAGDAGSDAGASSTSGCIDPSDPSLASEPIRIADSPILSGGALVGDAGPLLAPDAGGALVCQMQISLFTIGPVGDGGVLIASATPQQAINYNLPGTCGGAVGPNCSLANSIGGVHTGFPVGSTCDKVAGTTDQVECDVSIGSLAHDTCCGQYPNGIHCGGPGPATKDCTDAWNRAQSDYVGRNFWRERFTAGKVAPAGWTAVEGAEGPSGDWLPAPNFYYDGLCIPDSSYELQAPLEAAFCCHVPQPEDYNGHCLDP